MNSLLSSVITATGLLLHGASETDPVAFNLSYKKQSAWCGDGGVL
jgi:hypothetical protein